MNKYVQSCRSEFWQKVFRAEADCIVRHLKGARDILSVGCGPAVVEGILEESGLRVTGLDVSQDALGCAPDGVRTVVAKAEDMPFPDASFDAVIFVASLQFIEGYAQALHETTRVLRPGGAILVLLLNPESEFFRDKMRNPDSYVRKIRHTDLTEIETEMAKAYDVHAEYCLGVNGDSVFESRRRDEACLYAIEGTLKSERKRDK